MQSSKMQNVMTWKYNAFKVDDVIKYIIIYYAFSIFSEYYKEYSNHSKQSIVYKAKLPHILPQGEELQCLLLPVSIIRSWAY